LYICSKVIEFLFSSGVDIGFERQWFCTKPLFSDLPVIRGEIIFWNMICRSAYTGRFRNFSFYSERQAMMVEKHFLKTNICFASVRVQKGPIRDGDWDENGFACPSEYSCASEMYMVAEYSFYNNNVWNDSIAQYKPLYVF
jgi:hypothetical protein